MRNTDETHRLLITGLLRELPTSDSPSYEHDMAKWLRAARTILDLLRVMELPAETEAQPDAIPGATERKRLLHAADAHYVRWLTELSDERLLQAAADAHYVRWLTELSDAERYKERYKAALLQIIRTLDVIPCDEIAAAAKCIRIAKEALGEADG